MHAHAARGVVGSGSRREPNDHSRCAVHRAAVVRRDGPTLSQLPFLDPRPLTPRVPMGQSHVQTLQYARPPLGQVARAHQACTCGAQPPVPRRPQRHCTRRCLVTSAASWSRMAATVAWASWRWGRSTIQYSPYTNTNTPSFSRADTHPDRHDSTDTCVRGAARGRGEGGGARAESKAQGLNRTGVTVLAQPARAHSYASGCTERICQWVHRAHTPVDAQSAYASGCTERIRKWVHVATPHKGGQAEVRYPLAQRPRCATYVNHDGCGWKDEVHQKRVPEPPVAATKNTCQERVQEPPTMASIASHMHACTPQPFVTKAPSTTIRRARRTTRAQLQW
jgi:hypothetical protein